MADSRCSIRLFAAAIHLLLCLILQVLFLDLYLQDFFSEVVADVEQWLKTSGAPELQLLLGYVYYQMGRGQRAKEAINAAYQKMPESAAVQAVKKAI